MVIVAPSGVLVAAVLLALFLRSPFCVDIVSDVSLFWRAAIRTLVAQISNRRARTGLFKDRLHCASLVAAYAQFHVSLELQQLQPVGPRQGLEKCPCPLLNERCLAHRSATSMQDRCIRLVLKEPAETVAFEQRTQHLQFLAGGCRRRLQLTSTIGEEALGSVQTPDFKGGSMPSSGRISCAERPEMIAMRVLPCCWMRVNNSRTPAQGLARKRSTRNGASVPS